MNSFCLEKNNLIKENSFKLGVQAEELPLEPEEINREYYNLGLKFFHLHKKIHWQSDLIRLVSNGENSFWEDRDNFVDFREAVIASSKSLSRIDELYWDYLCFAENLEKENPNLVKILEKHLNFDLSYTVCRDLYRDVILNKKKRFDKAYAILFDNLSEIVEK
ncbi:MAG: hypothetical protein WC812_01485 [Candidatus Pacearchaeota archaeon]|jgi:hypothetical protein